MTRPRLLDLFCGAGGAGEGYRRAGFDVVGVDLINRGFRSGDFVQADALAFLEREGDAFDVVHASPPCLDHTPLANMTGGHESGWLLSATLERLRARGGVWVVENVVGPSTRRLMPDAMKLCGSEFDLWADCGDGVRRQLRRHRLFSSNAFLMGAGGCHHQGEPIGVYGNGSGRVNTAYGNATGGRFSYRGRLAERRQAMGIDWMGVRDLALSIPPAYTEHIGWQLLDELARRAAA